MSIGLKAILLSLTDCRRDLDTTVVTRSVVVSLGQRRQFDGPHDQRQCFLLLAVSLLGYTATGTREGTEELLVYCDQLG